MTDRDSLPIPDYDHLPVGSLESRIRSLDQAGVEALLVHESKHGNRVPVMNVLRQRLQALQAGAKPSGGSGEQGTMPEVSPAPSSGDKASPQTTGPPVNPWPQGDPRNPPQPKR